MAIAGGVDLALAVAAAGGIPALPGAAMSTDELRAGIRRVRAAGHEPIVNFFAHSVSVRRLEDDVKWLRFLRPTYEAAGLVCDARVFSVSDAEIEANIDSANNPGCAGSGITSWAGLSQKDLPHWFAQTAGRNPFDAASLELVLEEAVSMVSFHFGLPRSLPQRSFFAGETKDTSLLLDEHRSFLADFRSAAAAAAVRQTTTFSTSQQSSPLSILSTATTPEECRHLAAAGVDGIILQGSEAGGHRGNFLAPLSPDSHLPTVELVRQSRHLIHHESSAEGSGTSRVIPGATLTTTRAPLLIAAGGIATSDDVRAAMLAGADAVQVGTAFLNCVESSISPLFRNWLVQGVAESEGVDDDDPTTVTTGFTGRPARGYANAVAALVPFTSTSSPSIPVPPFPFAVDGWSPIRKIREAKGSADFTPMLCGTKVASSCYGPPRRAKTVVEQLRDVKL
jgi:nitronate monooxygenase